MAGALSQEEVLDFLCRAGGRATNAALLGHFARFLRDPALPPEVRLRHRDCFKRYVNSVAVVRQESAPGAAPSKVVVLRARYRDLLGEEEPPDAAGEPPQLEGSWGHTDSELQPPTDRPSEAPRTFTAAYESEGSKSHACLGGQQQIASHAGYPTIQHGIQTKVSGEQHLDTSGIPANWPTKQVSRDLGSVGSSVEVLCPYYPSPLGDKPTPAPTPARRDNCTPTNPPLPSPLGGNSRLYPLSIGSDSPCHPAAGDTPPPFPSPIKDTTQPCCPLSFGISPPHPSFVGTPPCSSSLGSSSPPFAPPLMDPLLCPASSRVTSPSTPPRLRNTSPGRAFVGVSSPPRPSSLSLPSSPCLPPFSANSPNARLSSPPNHPNARLSSPSNHPNARLSSPPNHTALKGPSPTSPSSGTISPPFRGTPVSSGATSSCGPPLEATSPGLLSSHTHFPRPISGIVNSQLPPSITVSPPSKGTPETFTPSSGSSSPTIEGSSLPIPPLDLYIPLREEEWLPVYPPPFLSSPPILPGDGQENGWWGHLPVFKSIRSQLSLQDLDDFVEQATNESDDSDGSSGTDSSAMEKYQGETGVSPATTGWVEKCTQESSETQWHDTYLGKSSDHTFKELAVLGRFGEYERTTEACGMKIREAPITVYRTSGAFLQPTVPLMARTSQQLMRSEQLQHNASSSDDEILELEFRKESRLPSNITTRMSLFTPSPILDLTLASVPIDPKRIAADSAWTARKQVFECGLSNEVAGSESKRVSSHRSSSLVPLDPREHEWIVKLASASWMQVHGLFTEDPQMALRRDFISGYTALHWIAKHGNCRMFLNLLSGADKAGIKLDVDVKSTGGYTPLHLAAIHGHEKVIKLLVEKLKAKVTVRDHSGKRAWQYLCSTTTGEVWQLLGAPKGKTIFPVCSLPAIAPAAKSTRSHDALNKVSRKTSLAAFLKPQHLKWKSTYHGNRPPLKEVHSD
ncbi:ankyrin repeat domain-containing protein SOWAHB [Ambystoma mexicanum]|uniref:ankyrin repeat domain-containing protein SOWAHB n=1 Tax=Ambystoma mexicanum TaxID=8296 RepID=UPI0037E733B3